MVIKEFIHFLKFESKFGPKIFLKDLISINKLYFKGYYLKKLIDFIDDKDIRVTFFFNTKGLVKRKRLIKRLVSEGHEICSHGHNHYNFKELNKEEILRDFKASDRMFKRLNLDVKGFRPPFLCFNPEILSIAKKFNYEYISSQLGLNQEFFYKNRIKEVGVIKPYDWQGLVLMNLKFNDIIKEWDNKKGVLLLHPWIINPYYKQLDKFIKKGKDYRICSGNKLKISFDVH
jgi:peptidoglycan/xylan/chitin deacetylase (PgdA/CDA1 family)|tara:strand:- start:35 stop:727 length:693 start_codon:yes stop_codon:yes gene_type:complete